jgi:hypothetical protein
LSAKLCRAALGRALLVSFLLGASTAAAVASTPVLTLVGASGESSLELTLEELQALPQVTIRTANEFTDGIVAYRGPLVRDVLAMLRLDRLETVRFVAANDYFVDIPTEDFRSYEVILAMEANGRQLSRREKGPLWLMYPISDHPELRDPVYLRRLIWQVVRIEAP